MSKCTLALDIEEDGYDMICDGCMRIIKHDEKRLIDDGSVVALCLDCCKKIAELVK